ncbi:probable RNA helicase armi [Agrilus planipennis]|uniref:Probable RNA helicase armi n=1 Tax=Agrilus planipennis TaxID=224129 RepID=A0A7F5RFM0_AGRPL|nr:probable RNA helicase armi [Agrilus planipennis]
MFRTVLSYFWKDNSSEFSVDNAYKLLEKSCENDVKKEDDICEETEQEYSTYHKTGVVTSAKKNTFIIDNTYRFECDVINLKVGMKVSFVAYFAEGKTHVSHVKVLDDDWNLEVDEENRSWCTRSLITKVVKRENRKIHISPGDFIINLNKVHSEFVPIVGDWIDLQVKVEVEWQVADLFGKILEVEAIRPLRPRVLQGVIKKWDQNKGMGVIDNKIFFNSESLVGGYTPLVNDKVITEAIESEQGMYIWRSLKIIPQTNKQHVNDFFYKLCDSEYETDVEGVNISDDIYLNVSENNKTYNFVFEITNNTKDLLILLNAYFSNKSSPFKISTTFNEKGLEISAGQSLKIECECFVVCTASNLILFDFEKFKIGRQVTINYETNKQPYDKAKHVHGNNLLLQARMFTNRKSKDLIPGQKVVQTPRFISARLPEYPVPEKLFNIILKHNSFNDNPQLSQELTSTKPCLTASLTLSIYEDKFHTLLHLEEIYNLIAIRTYDQDAACFIRNGEYLMLEIENLSERRPSIIVGDRIIAKDSYKNDAVSYEGYVHKVGAKHIYIKFAPMFHDSYGGEDYSVKVVSSRTTFRRLHQAVGLVVRNLGSTILLPTKVVEKAPQLNFTYDEYYNILHTTHKKLKNRSLSDATNCGSLERKKDNKEDENTIPNQGSKLLLNINTEDNFHNENKKWRNNNYSTTKTPISTNNRRFKLEWYDKSLNYYQKEAVRNVLVGTARPLPYVIFGPPGTGKTVTLIEIILQILRMIPHSRLLVAAPSNSAADLLATRLVDSGVLKPGDLVRLVAFKYVLENSVPPKLVPYSATIDYSKEGSRECSINMRDDGIVLGKN